MQPLVGAQSEHQLEHLRVGDNALTVSLRIDEAGRGHNLETRIEPDHELGRHDFHWIEPNWVPSIWRGIEPSWLAG